VTTYAYDANNELQNVRIPGVGNIEYPSYTVNRPERVIFPGGTQQSSQYDALLRLKQISAPEADVNDAYTYDDVSNILTKSTEHGQYGYSYDAVARLTRAEHPTLPTETYAYDDVGNRRTASNASGSLSHNANNELLLYGNMAYDYDANGNLIRKRLGTVAVNYSYNAQNRLIRVEDELSGLVIAEYGYDPFGRRLWKAVNGVRTYFLYADEGLVAEYDEQGRELHSYGWQPDSTWGTNPLWLKQDSVYYWYQNDHLGTPQKLLDSTGTLVWEARYTAFGNAEILVNTVENNLRFPGQYYDAETGLHYNFHRYYDPMTGRYTQVDPIGFAGGDVNWYAYVGNNPVSWVDPNGLNPFEALFRPMIIARKDVNPANTFLRVIEPPLHHVLAYPKDFCDGIDIFGESYRAMRTGNVVGADQYYHCMANCKAARRGIGGEHAAIVISLGREIVDFPKNILRRTRALEGGREVRRLSISEALEDAVEDMTANAQGRYAPLNISCDTACRPLLPVTSAPYIPVP
jgi:RHS repeat-associated protein